MPWSTGRYPSLSIVRQCRFAGYQPLWPVLPARRLWRSVKYEEVCLKVYQDGREARIALDNYFRFYNTERPHQALGYRTPAEVFTSTAVEATSTGMLESLTPDPLRIAVPTLNTVSTLS